MRVTEVAVTIDREGTVELHVRGMAGPGCEALTAPVERRLGGAVTRRHTVEYDRPPEGEALPAAVRVRARATPDA